MFLLWDALIPQNIENLIQRDSPGNQRFVFWAGEKMDPGKFVLAIPAKFILHIENFLSFSNSPK